MMDRLNVTVSNGKYTVIQKADGTTTVLRYGEPWPAFEEGKSSLDNLHLALAHEVQRLRAIHDPETYPLEHAIEKNGGDA